MLTLPRKPWNPNGSVGAGERVGPVRAGARQRAVDIADIADARREIRQVGLHILLIEGLAGRVERGAAHRDAGASLLV